MDTATGSDDKNTAPVIDWKNLISHPAADMFPRMLDSEIKSLANSILLNGQMFPIMLTKDGEQILDGRNRVKAYQHPLLEGLEPVIEVYQGPLTPMDYVRSVNWERLHLSQSQRTALAVLLLPEAKRKAAERQQAGETLASVEAKGKAAEEVAKQMNVSKAQVERLAAVQKEAPEVFEAVKEGKSTVRAAHSKLPKKDKGKKAEKKVEKKPASTDGDIDRIIRTIENLQKCSLAIPGASEIVRTFCDADIEYAIDELNDVAVYLDKLVTQIHDAKRLRDNNRAALLAQKAANEIAVAAQ
jgi:hypothetical protein